MPPCAPTATVTFGARRSGSRSRRAASTPARRRRRLGLAPREHEHSLVPPRVLAEVPRKTAEPNEVPRRLGARRRRLARADRRAMPRREAALPRRRRLRGRRRARVDAARARAAPARGGQAAAARGRRPLSPRRPSRSSRSRRRPARSRSAPASGASDGTQRARRLLLERSTLPVVLDADALWELEPFARAAPTVLTPHAGELARLLGDEAAGVDAHRLEAVGARASRFGCVVPAQGRRHAGRRAARGRARRDARARRARDRRHRRRAHRRRRRVPREGARAARRGRRRRGATASPRLDPQAGASPATRGALPLRARAPVRSTIDLGAVRRNAARAAAGARGGGALGRREGERLRPRRGRCAGAARAQARPRCASRPSPRRSSCAGAPARADPGDGPDASSREVAQAREAGLELVGRSGPIPKACPCTSSSTRAWADGGSAELPRRRASRRPDDAPRDRRHRPRFAARRSSASARRPAPTPDLTRHVAQQRRGAAAPESRFDAAGAGSRSTASRRSARTPPPDGLEPALSWRSELAQVKLLRPGESTGYGRRFVAERDHLDRDRPGRLRRRLPPRADRNRGRVEGERRRVVGTVSMDAFAVELDRECLSAPR